MDWPIGTDIRVVSVIEPLPPVTAAEWAGPISTVQDSYPPEADAVAQSILENACQAFAHTRAEVSSEALRGRAATRILERAREVEADLIIVGSRGHGTIASMVLGSVGAEVADLADCPVLVARGPHLTRLVLGVDQSEFSRLAEAIVAEWPIFANVGVEVTHVAQTSLPWTLGLGQGNYEPPQIDPEEHEAVSGATRRLREAGRRAQGRMVTGDPAAGLIDTAKDVRAELIVVGTHGRTGLNRAVFGSVARNVMLHAPCSVLVVRRVRARAEQSTAA
jgi:nucleotide-binding universal stress UspA family protein